MTTVWQWAVYQTDLQDGKCTLYESGNIVAANEIEAERKLTKIYADRGESSLLRDQYSYAASFYPLNTVREIVF